MNISNFFKSGSLLFLGNLVTAISGLLRNVIIARLISVENFGIAATFAVTVSFVEMSNAIAVDRLLVQDRQGNNSKLQATSQAFLAIRGVLNAAVLYFAAGFIGRLFELQQLTWAFEVLALIPLLRGFAHLDVARLQRQMKFTAVIASEALPQLLTVVLATPLALYFGDYRVMLWILILQTIAQVIGSHLLAIRKYRWSWKTKFIKKIMIFGWPLLLNGFVMFGIFQADRIIVGSLFNMEMLGWFSAAFTLTLLPSLLLTRVHQSLFLPILSLKQNLHTNFQQYSLLTFHICLLSGLLLSVGFLLAGPAFFLLIFGDKYSEGVTIIALLGLMQGFRLFKLGPIIIALAKGRTKLPLLTNLVRGFWIIIAVAVANTFRDIQLIVLCGVIGEFTAFIFSLIYLKKMKIVKLQKVIPTLVVSLMCLLGAFLMAIEHIIGAQPLMEIALTAVVLLVIVLCYVRSNAVIIRLLKTLT